MSEVELVGEATRKLVNKLKLTDNEIFSATKTILTSDVPGGLIAAFLTALTMTGTTTREIKIIREVLRNESVTFSICTNGSLIDNCGTGGDMTRSFNISTAAAIIAAAAGAMVVKHGNRSASGLCGSADFLESIGFDLNTSADYLVNSVKRIGISFFYAPKFHPSLMRISPIRKQLGFKTVFNILGPLSNPCNNLSGQVIGISDPNLIEPIASIMRDSDIDNVILVHSDDGHDELSNTCESTIVQIKNSESVKHRFNPKSLGLNLARPEEILISSFEDSVKSTLQVIYGEAPGARQDIVLLNSSLALLVAKKVDSIEDGIEMARNALRSSSPKLKLRQLVNSCGDLARLEEIENMYGLNN